MNYRLGQKEGKSYIELISAPKPLSTEQDALELAALCGELDTGLMLIHYDVFDKGFFRQKTGMAGAILQKFSNYYIKAAVLLPEKKTGVQINKAHNFKVFDTREEAEKWLLD